MWYESPGHITQNPTTWLHTVSSWSDRLTEVPVSCINIYAEYYKYILITLNKTVT
jgi:hypothetical protein